MKHLLLILAATVLASTAHGNWCQAQEERDLAEFLFDPFLEPIGRTVLGMDAAQAVKERFGEPLDVVREVRQGWQEPGRDTIVQMWHYEGLMITLVGMYPERMVLEEIVLTNPRIPLKLDIRLGDSRDDLRRKLRMKELGDGMMAPYCDDAGSFTAIQMDLEFQDGRVVRISWRYEGRL